MNKTLLPKLRFPEFQDEWEGYFGNQLFDPISNKEHNSSLPVLAITQEHGAIPRDLIDYQVFVTDKSIASYKVVEVGDFIISLRSFQGGIEYSEYKGLCSPAYIILRKKNELSEAYFKYFFKTERFIQQLQKNLEGLRDGKMVSYEQFSELLLPTPTTAEQQKIADCLTSLDDLIAAQSQKVAALQAYKKGLMQNLFPAEGASAPRLRFPEFQSAGEWEEKTLGDISTFSSGGTPSKDVPEYWNGTIPWISASSMYDTNIVNSELKITDVAVKNGAQIAKKGSLLILVRGSMLYKRVPMGIAAIDIAFNQDVKALKITQNVNVIYLLYQLLAFESRIPIHDTGIGAGKIDTDDLKRLTIHVATLPEQQRIAELLSVVDEEIIAQGEVLAALKVHKQGLMQGLFPSGGG